MELTLQGVQALEAAIHAGDGIVATLHHAVAALLPASPEEAGIGCLPAPCRC
jgi:hypothetical protein